jgi:hypothetical protein
MEKESRDHEEANPDPAKQTQAWATEPRTEGEQPEGYGEKEPRESKPKHVKRVSQNSSR